MGCSDDILIIEGSQFYKKKIREFELNKYNMGIKLDELKITN